MIARHLTFAAISLLGAPWSTAQIASNDLPQSPVREVLRKLNGPNGAQSNDATDPPAPVAQPPVSDHDEPAPDIDESAPDLDKPATEPAAAAATGHVGPAATPPSAAIAADPAPAPRQGLAVRVEKLQVGSGHIDPAQVKLRAPFPAKPLAPAPAGWTLTTSKNAPPFTREVELSTGTKITLTIRPHILVPDADGVTTFNLPEPGFDASQGYRQDATVGAILAHSIQQLDSDAKALGSTIDQLQQILVSLPKPPPMAVTIPQSPIPTEPTFKPAPTRKR